jgi:secreted Zn-dependent insulinase-like peptidase
MRVPVKQHLTTLLILLLVNVTTTNNARASNEITQSQYDTKEYLTFTLANKLKVLVISDTKSDISAASLVVTAGQRNAPANYLGLPHLLEHAVFLGSKNYPEPSEFDRFIKGHHGWSNGSTRTDNTRYHFQLDHQALDEGLKRLADFLSFPLLDQKSIEKARIAVDNEFQGRTSDWRKTLAILRQESNPAHPAAKFGTGNALSLKGDLTLLKKELTIFHRQYYGAQNITLVIYGKDPVAVLKKMATKHFSQIKQSKLSDKKSMEPLHFPAQLANQIELNIQSDIASLDIRFEVPANNNITIGSAETLAAYLLGHEAEGSLYAYLKNQGLISRLQVNPEGDRHYGIFALYIQLTDKGLANKDKVIESVFSYINLLSTQPLPNWISQDIQIAEKRSFDFPADQEPGDWISTISYDMLFYPKTHWLNHKTVITTKQFTHYLTYLTPENMQLVFSHQKTQVNKVESIYNTPYRVAAFSQTQLALWKKAKMNEYMSFPAKNPYFINELTRNDLEPTIVPEQEHAELAINGKGLSLWSQQKTDISTNKISTKIRFYDALGMKNNLVRNVHRKVLQEYLFGTSYFANLAGFDFTVDTFASGYTLEVNGHSGNYFDFLQQVIAAFFQYQPSEKAFNIAKQELLYDIDYRKNYYRPYEQVQRAVYQTLVNEESDDNLAKDLVNLSYKDYLSVNNVNKKFQLSGLVIGNINNNKLTSFADELQINVKKQLSANLKTPPKIKQLSQGKKIKEIHIEHSDSSIAFAIQAHDNSIKSQANFFLVNAILQRKYYHSIRTDKALAYFVHMKQLSTFPNANIVMVAQSGNSSAEQLSQASNDFLTGYAETLKGISEVEFQQHLDSAIGALNAPVFNLNAYTRKLEQELYATSLNADPVTLKTTAFNNKQEIITALKSLTKKQFVKFYHQQVIGKDSKGLLLFSTGKAISKVATN